MHEECRRWSHLEYTLNLSSVAVQECLFGETAQIDLVVPTTAFLHAGQAREKQKLLPYGSTMGYHACISNPAVYRGIRFVNLSQTEMDPCSREFQVLRDAIYTLPSPIQSKCCSIIAELNSKHRGLSTCTVVHHAAAPYLSNILVIEGALRNIPVHCFRQKSLT
jgi:hypothetical protein